ncbi:MAG: hypothetical protein IJU16_03465 [Clostridia bacterium]|nr:hypothetical protein [Clostridia bacterium]
MKQIEKQPVRKHTRLSSYDYSENGAYFVTICTKNRENILATIDIEIADVTNLSNDIRSFKIMVTKEIGRPIFQTSFYDHIIRTEEDYLAIWQYIDDNPIKWTLDEYFRW